MSVEEPITDSHEEKSGADVARGHGPRTERVQVSWHDRRRRCLRAGRWPKMGDVREANEHRPTWSAHALFERCAGVTSREGCELAAACERGNQWQAVRKHKATTRDLRYERQ